MTARVLVIDNYDSFAYNLVQYLWELSGARPEVVRNDELAVSDLAGLDVDGIVISPGPCGPRDAGISVAVVERLGARVPILGVCLGHQCIAAAYGGRVARAPRPVHGKSSLVTHDGRGLYAGVPNPLTGGRYHSLAVDPQLPATLAVSAWSDDGVVMGIRHRRHPVEGVQFHPESVLTAGGHALVANFLARVAGRRIGVAS